jgi:hypothetical protein
VGWSEADITIIKSTLEQIAPYRQAILIGVPILIIIFIFEVLLFVLGLVILIAGKIPLSRMRSVNDAAARIIGVVLMIPLLLYLIGCKLCHISPVATQEEIDLVLDPLLPFSIGYMQIGVFVGTMFCLTVAGLLTAVTAETKRR